MDLTTPDRGEWRLVDRMLAAYGLLVAVVAATRIHQTGVAPVLAAHLGLTLLAWLTVRAPTSAVMRVIRGVYPVLILTALYSAIDVLNRFGAIHTFDRTIQTAEFAIFHMQPSRDWWRMHPSAFWSTVLHAAYLAYYAVISIPLLWFLALRRTERVEWYLNGLLATYLVCYLFYLFLPVAGPYYEFPPPSGMFIANLPARWVYAALSGGSAFGAAFPSSHVAATVAATIGAWRWSRRLGMVLAVPTALLVVGVVYCQMHYVIDSVTGLLVGAVVAGTVASMAPREIAGRRRF